MSDRDATRPDNPTDVCGYVRLNDILRFGEILIKNGVGELTDAIEIIDIDQLILMCETDIPVPWIDGILMHDR
jgi:hypothetical protein